MEIKNYYKPSTIKEAYDILQSEQGVIIGGGIFLNLSDIVIKSAVDLSNINLDFITETDEYIEIGSMTTLRKLETNESLNKYFNSIIPKAISNIMGVQIRNMATIGGSIWGRYGFSDIITALLVLDTTVELYKAGKLKLEKFLDSNFNKDIITRIIIKKDGRTATYENLRNSALDFPVINTAVAKKDNDIFISVGARPLRAKLSHEAMKFISNTKINMENAKKGGELASKEISFGSDNRGSAQYRKELCKVLVKRGILEVAQ